MARSSETNSPLVLLACLWVCAGLSALGGLSYGIVRLRVAAENHKLDAVVFLGSLGCLIAGLSAGCILWAAAYMVRRLNRPRVLPPAPAPGQGDSSNQTSASQTGSIDPHLAERILDELSEINTNLLIPEDERQAKRRTRQLDLTQTIVAEAEQAIQARDFQRAQRVADRLRSELGDTNRYELLQQRIVEGRAAAQSEHIAAESRRIEELMSVASFRQAQDIARELAARYPDDRPSYTAAKGEFILKTLEQAGP